MNIRKMWENMKESNAAKTEMKFFEKEGDTEPFRLILFVDGKDEVRRVLEFLRKDEES